MRKHIRIFFLIGALLLSPLSKEAICAEDEPIYIWPTMQFVDHLNPKYSYWLFARTLAIWEALDIRGQIFLSGEVVRNYESIRGTPLKPDVDTYEIGYHGEVSVGPYPILIDYYKQPAQKCGTLAMGKDWSTLPPEAITRYTHQLNPLTGKVDLNESGGLELVHSATGKKISAIVSRQWEAAPAGYAFRSLPGVLSNAIEFGPFPSQFAEAGRPEAVETFNWLTGRELVWYMGILNFVPDEQHASVGRLNELYRSRPHLVNLNLTDHAIYAKGDVFNWAYNNANWGCEPPDLTQAMLPTLALKSGEEIQKYLFNYTVSTIKMVNSFLAKNPRCRLVTATDILDLVVNDYGKPVPQKKVEQIADMLAILRRWEAPRYYGPGIRRPPSYLTDDESIYYSMAEAFSLLVETMAHYYEHGCFPASVANPFRYGPLEIDYPTGPSGLEGKAVTGTALLKAAREVKAQLGAYLPAYIEVGTYRLNLAEFTYLLAVEYTIIRDTGLTKGLKIRDIYPLSYDYVLLRQIFTPPEPLPLLLSGLQLWTYKPARWHDLEANSPTEPQILMAGYADSNITTHGGGTLNFKAWLHDPDGSHVRNILVSEGLNPTPLLLEDNGRNGDEFPNDGIYTLQMEIPPGTPAGHYLLNLFAIDHGGYTSDVWPYFNIAPDLEKHYFEFFVPPGSTSLPRPLSWEWEYFLATLASVSGFNHPDGPRIDAGGFFTSMVNKCTGGYWTCMAKVSDPQGIENVRRVLIIAEGEVLEYEMNDMGANGDQVERDGIFSMELLLPLGLPEGDHLVAFIAEDTEGNLSFPWPFLTVRP